QDFYRLVCREQVTVLNQTPTSFQQLIRAQGETREAHQLRYIIFGGERLDVATIERWWEQNQEGRTGLVNMYGITETTVHVTYGPLERTTGDRRGRSPIGRRIPDLRIYILDENQQPVP